VYIVYEWSFLLTKKKTPAQIKGLLAQHLEKNADLPKLQALCKYLGDFAERENVTTVSSKPQLDINNSNDDTLRRRIVEDYRAIVAAKYLKFTHDSPFDEIASHKEAAAAAKRERELIAQQQQSSNALLDAQRQAKKQKLPSSFVAQQQQQSNSSSNGAAANSSLEQVRQLKQQLATVQGERKILRDFVIAMRTFTSAMGHSETYAQCFAELEDKMPQIFIDEQQQQGSSSTSDKPQL